MIMYLRRLDEETSTLWIPVILIVILLVPTTAGKHIAAETILFPMLAASIVLIATGRRYSLNGLTTFGLLVGGMSTMFKWEGGLIFTVGVLPWLFTIGRPNTSRLPMSLLLRWVAVTILACLPLLIWKSTLTLHNQFFGQIDVYRFLDSGREFVDLARTAAHLMLDDGRIFLFVFALPCAMIFSRNSHFADFIIPISILACLAGWIVIFIFSNLSPATYLETSYSRLIMIPTFSAILYCADVLIDRSKATLVKTDASER
jgi:hypothetical protein